MAITLTVTTTNYATTAAANNVYALTAAETPAVEDSTYYLTDSAGELLIDSETIYLIDSEG